jgi:hypothetical protein
MNGSGIPPIKVAETRKRRATLINAAKNSTVTNRGFIMMSGVEEDRSKEGAAPAPQES